MSAYIPKYLAWLIYYLFSSFLFSTHLFLSVSNIFSWTFWYFIHGHYRALNLLPSLVLHPSPSNLPTFLLSCLPPFPLSSSILYPSRIPLSYTIISYPIPLSYTIISYTIPLSYHPSILPSLSPTSFLGYPPSAPFAINPFFSLSIAIDCQRATEQDSDGDT